MNTQPTTERRKILLSSGFFLCWLVLSTPQADPPSFLPQVDSIDSSSHPPNSSDNPCIDITMTPHISVLVYSTASVLFFHWAVARYFLRCIWRPCRRQQFARLRRQIRHQRRRFRGWLSVHPQRVDDTMK